MDWLRAESGAGAGDEDDARRQGGDQGTISVQSRDKVGGVGRG